MAYTGQCYSCCGNHRGRMMCVSRKSWIHCLHKLSQPFILINTFVYNVIRTEKKGLKNNNNNIPPIHHHHHHFI